MTGEPMKIIWSDFASRTLKDIFDYHKDVAGKRIAQKIKNHIFDSTKQLKIRKERPEDNTINKKWVILKSVKITFSKMLV